MGPQVFLRMPVLKKDKPVRIEFMAFGGGWVDQTLKRAMEATPHTGVFVSHNTHTVYIYVCIYMHIYVCLYICTYIYRHTYIGTHTYIYAMHVSWPPSFHTGSTSAQAQSLVPK